MPRNDDGEFELVLGNRQLLSVFFLVIVLLGVFFAMGYIMGRSGNTTTLAELKKPDNSPTERPIVVDVGGSQAKPSAAGAPVTPKEEPKPEPPAKKEPVQEDPPKVAEKKPEPPPKPEPKKPEPPPAPAPAVTGGAPSGAYLQVAAVKKAEADIVASIVAKRGYRAYLIPLKEGSDVYRVLVGPARDRDQQSKMLEDLKADGFKPFPRKL